MTVTFVEASAQCQSWDEMAILCQRVVDRLDTPIDPLIFECVVALNLLGISTMASCEGHEDHGTYAPYIDIKATNSQEAEQTARSAGQEAEKLRRQGSTQEEIAETFRRVRCLQEQAEKSQLEVRSRLLDYLDAFYATYSACADLRLVLQYRPYAARLENQGAALQRARSPEERTHKLHAYQEEMARFSAFLKEAWFSDQRQ